MKIYLDTNIVLFFLFKQEELSIKVSNMLFDYSNILLTSTVCVDELIHLCQIGKIGNNKKKPILSQRLLQHLEEAGIDIVSVNRKHLQQVAELKLYDDHRDPNDRLIIAQAIADKTVLISSDRKFERYNNLGLHFIFNKR